MTGPFHNLRRRHAQASQLRVCRENGHFLVHSGQLGDDSGAARLWIMLCKCGYGEMVDVGTKPYVRGFEEAERLKKERSIGVVPTQ